MSRKREREEEEDEEEEEEIGGKHQNEEDKENVAVGPSPAKRAREEKQGTQQKEEDQENVAVCPSPRKRARAEETEGHDPKAEETEIPAAPEGCEVSGLSPRALFLPGLPSPAPRDAGVAPSPQGSTRKPMKLKTGARTAGGRPEDGEGRLAAGIRALYCARDLCDVNLVCGEASFPAHRVVLAGQSEVLRGLLRGAAVVRLDGEISQPEAARLLLEFVYEIGDDVVYAPASLEVNADVLRLAHKFQLPELKRRAAVFMAQRVTTRNAVECLNLCDDFGLAEMKQRILSKVAASKRAVAEVTGSPTMTAHPELLREVLMRVAAAPSGGAEQETPRKRVRS